MLSKVTEEGWNKAISQLTYLARRAEENPRLRNPDFYTYDYAGGNIDDAYDIGFWDGQESLSVELLRMLCQDS